MPRWAQSLGPIAEHVAHVFGDAMAGKYSPATPLTRSRTKAAQAVVKARKASVGERKVGSGRRCSEPRRCVGAHVWSCPDCGGAVTNRLHVRCDACIEADPAQTPEIRGRRGAAISARKRALTEWERANPGATYDPELFRREILPRTPDRETLRDRRGGRVLEGVGVGHPPWQADAARVHMGGAGCACWDCGLKCCRYLQMFGKLAATTLPALTTTAFEG